MLSAVVVDGSLCPSAVKMIEAAANGSTMGDPIEVGAVSGAMLGDRSDELCVSSVKANVGHTESASGMVGLAKLLCAQCQQEATPNAQLNKLALHISTTLRSDASTCLLPINLTAVPSGHLNGTVSSFGLGGTIGSALLQVQQSSDPEFAENHVHCINSKM